MQATFVGLRANRTWIKGLWCACAAVLLSSCSTSEGAKQEAPTSVKVFKIAEVADDAKREFPFISKPNKSNRFSFQVSGKCLDVFDAHPGSSTEKVRLLRR